MVAHHVQERLVLQKLLGRPDGVAVAQRLPLGHEVEPVGAVARGARVGRLVARPDHHADLLHAGAKHFLHQDAEHGFLRPVAVREGLQRQASLFLARRGDDGFGDSHTESAWYHQPLS